MVIDPLHKYSNDAKRANYDIYNYFKFSCFIQKNFRALRVNLLLTEVFIIEIANKHTFIIFQW